MQTRNFFLHAFALAGGLALGCVFTSGDGDLDDDGDCPGANNHEFGDECFCDAGYEWADPGDPDNLTCVPETAKEGECSEPNNILIGNECHCDDQFTWCSDDPNDFSCCPDDGHNGGTGGGTGNDDVADSGSTDDAGTDTGNESVDDTGPDPDTGVEPDPADCTEDGLSFCSNTEEQGPEGSRYWVCTGGEWVEDTEAGDAACQFDQYDFAYGCVATESAVEFVCGEGPGTDCEGDAATCADMDIISYCFMGKLTEDSCMRICTEEGDDMGVTYDYGECSADSNECFCCDAGEEGCPAE